MIIGIVQGITEFLPISSSGHLVVISSVMNWNDQGVFTDIAVHVGTLFAVIIYLFSYIKKIIIEFFFFNKNSSKERNHLGVKIIFATLPAIIIGFFVYEYLLQYFRNLVVIGWASIIFGIILFIADQTSKSIKKWEDLKFWEVLIIGLFQVLAFIPGASRAGVTITGSRILNVKRDSAAIFSMLLSIPIIAASLFLGLYDYSIAGFTTINLTQSILASIVAFITAMLSIHAMMTILQFTNFNIFIIYRIILGITLLVFYA
ncbi:undecaprenyl-diphosphate phosphatase [Alphaproteobacteria bacterium]|nr:undecaprenyl-diphosphate phosphatase [Alphaproteobacteria bacterium]